jgi:hypothetical protein
MFHAARGLPRMAHSEQVGHFVLSSQPTSIDSYIFAAFPRCQDYLLLLPNSGWVECAALRTWLVCPGRPRNNHDPACLIKKPK